jgi:methyl-accepting chemotaxis protein
MSHLTGSTKRIAFLWAALAVPVAVIGWLLADTGSDLQRWVLGAVVLACAFAAVLLSGSIVRLLNEASAKLDGIHKSREVIEYKPDGTIVWANERFLKLLGYRLEDIVGRHHSIFVDPEYARSEEYRQFWQRLGRGEFIEQRYKRRAAGGRDIYVLTNYTPVFGSSGRVRKVVNWMTDITAARREQEVVVETIAAGLKNLAAGDLTARIGSALQGDYDGLRLDFNCALERLQDAMKAILTGAGAISNGAGEISQAADDLSHRTEQQAASLEETAAALEEITATVKKTASNTKEASASVASARMAAESGGRVVETAIRAMDSIASSSKQITEIIGVIDEIAFQTNLLALNAGVEAARAGDAGRGFAVVASEVRALAQRSSEAAKQIKALIHTSSGHVSDGVKYVDESGEALKRIVEQVSQINALVGEIALAAEQQSTGIEQVNVAVSQMDQATQQNAAMVEQSTAASRNLAGETNSLTQLVGFFKVGEFAVPQAALQTGRTAKPKNNVHPSVVRTATTGSRAAVAVARKPVQEIPSEDWDEF